MAWVNGKRTVRCRHCWQTGHNIASCSTLTPEQKAARGVVANGKRTCRWCGETGHNRTSCHKRKRDHAEYILDNAAWRARVLELMKNKGVGIGALVSFKEARPDDNGNIPLYLIEKIEWTDVQKKDRQRRFLGCRELGATHQWLEYFSPEDIDTLCEGTRSWYWYMCKVLNGRPADEIAETVPVDWLKGESGTEGYFK